MKETSNVHLYNKGRLATFKRITIILLQLFTTHRSGLINIFWDEIYAYLFDLIFAKDTEKIYEVLKFTESMHLFLRNKKIFD